MKQHNEQESYNRDVGFDMYILYDASNREQYICIAYPGAATSAAVWSIYKLSYNANSGVVKRRYAGASDSFTNIADNAATLNYLDI